MLPYQLREFIWKVIGFYTQGYFLIVRFIFWLINAFKPRSYVTPPTDPLLLLSATKAVEAIANREITSTQLIESYIHRIEQVNDVINAVVLKLFESAKKKALEVDSFINSHSDDDVFRHIEEHPLFGVPFTMKDALQKEGEVITCGIYNRKEHVCEITAEAVKRMEAAGAILLAVTNVPEVCMWVESVNKIFGRSSNPYDTRRITGGSSGGEGALLGAAGSVIGIGSDIGGSIRMPSFFNGVFGFKSTPGIIPLVGHVPEPTGYKTNMLKIGPMCRYAEDLPLLFKVMGGAKAEALKLDQPVNKRSIKVFYMEGIDGNPFIQPLANEMRHSLRKAVRYLERKYDTVANKVELTLAKHVMEYFILSMAEQTTDPKFNKMMLCVEGSKGELNCYKELFNFITGKSNHTLAAILTGIIDSHDAFSEEQKNELKYKRDRLKRQIDHLLGEDGILVFPSWPCTALYHYEPLLMPINFSYTALWNALTFPVVQCPLGLDSKGVPLGVQVVGKLNSDRILLSVAKDLEDGFNGWVPAGPL